LRFYPNFTLLKDGEGNSKKFNLEAVALKGKRRKKGKNLTLL